MPGKMNAEKETEIPDPAFHWIDNHDIMMRLHISMRTLQSWRSKGWLPYSRIGKKIFYRESDLNDLLRKNMKSGIKES